jgi:exodeoxyribonuclease V beta subunit
MRAFQDFDLLNHSLEGTNLIEASAGTGKTYTLTALFLRLLLEKRLPINAILIVTFTEAATSEVKERVRNALREALGVLEGRPAKDSFIEALVKGVNASKTALRCLKEALRSFDEAAIWTIHGFCRRILHDNAFESGIPFHMALVSDEVPLKREIVEDFYRRYLYKETPLFVKFALQQKIGPDQLLKLIKKRGGRLFLNIIPREDMDDSSQEEKAYLDALLEVRAAWPAAGEEVAHIFLESEALNRSRYRRPAASAWISQMDGLAASREEDPFLFKGFEKFTTHTIRTSVKKGQTPPHHSFFDLCECLHGRQEAMESRLHRRLIRLKAMLFRHLQEELSRRKAEKDILSFDDLLLRVHHALRDRGGDLLSSNIRRRFRAALVDEFQDTDPIQYAIFRRLFDHPGNTLFLIGDPKQAIYGFRGADLFTYLEAARQVDATFTLEKNWRADPELIVAVNSVFQNVTHPFLFEDIPYQSAEPARKKRIPMKIHGESGSPLKLWFLPADSARHVNKGEARERISLAVAREILRLLSLSREQKAALGDRALREGDVAVLVRTNKEAHWIQKALSILEIPGVIHGTGNIFDSHEALEMERFMAAVMMPNHEASLKTALLTDMMGLSGEALYAMMAHGEQWEEWLVKFKNYQELWTERGFFRMFGECIRREGILPRLMSLSQGERRLTNLLHLSELLHQAALDKGLNRTALLKWLRDQRDPNSPRSEEHQIRLESDENAVKIITIHKSKGLEFPVIFCPFNWDGSRIRRGEELVIYHERGEGMEMTLDLGTESQEEHLILAEEELLAENLRLLYVALTRAIHRCYLIWGRFNEAGSSAPAYLFHHPGEGSQAIILDALEESWRNLSDEEMMARLEEIKSEAQGSLSLTELPEGVLEAYGPLPKAVVSLSMEGFSGKIDGQWGISSFSSLVTGRDQAVELADRDELGKVSEDEDDGDKVYEAEPSGLFAFPRGAKAGLFMHDLLENLDFTRADGPLLDGLVADGLSRYGFEPHWHETICRMVRNLLSTPLDEKREAFRLSNIPNHERINEMEFYFPLKSVSPEKLKEIVSMPLSTGSMTGFPEHLGQLHFSPTRGFMKGFIDMIFRYDDRFWLIDWKSNHLGNRVPEYGHEALEREMKAKGYILQYHIYLLALDQYLRNRLRNYDYERHFGGVFYLFLRGIDPVWGTPYGIYRDRPDPGLMDHLRANLIDYREPGTL